MTEDNKKLEDQQLEAVNGGTDWTKAQRVNVFTPDGIFRDSRLIFTYASDTGAEMKQKVAEIYEGEAGGLVIPSNMILYDWWWREIGDNETLGSHYEDQRTMDIEAKLISRKL